MATHTTSPTPRTMSRPTRWLPALTAAAGALTLAIAWHLGAFDVVEEIARGVLDLAGLDADGLHHLLRGGRA